MLSARPLLLEDTKNKLIDEIQKVKKINKGIRDIIISYFDGTPIISSTDQETEYILAAVAAALKGIADKVSITLQSGEFVKLILHYRNEKIILISINKLHVLVRALDNAPIGIIIRDSLALANKVLDLVPT